MNLELRDAKSTLVKFFYLYDITKLSPVPLNISLILGLISSVIMCVQLNLHVAINTVQFNYALFFLVNSWVLG